MVNYYYYQMFYYVAETENITTAAQKMFLSQSTVSRAIQALERDLGCTLMFRSKKGITLTEQGRILYSTVKKAVEIISETENSFTRTNKLNYSFLRIVANEFTMRYFLGPYLSKLEKEFPDIHMSFYFEPAATISEKLNSGLMDIAVLATPVQNLASDIVVEPLKEFQSIVIASPARAHLFHRPLDFTELEKEPFIGMVEGSAANEYIRRLFDEYHMEYRPKFAVSSGPAIISMVENDLGIGIIPKALGEDSIAAGRVAKVTLTHSLPVRRICALTSREFPVHTARDTFLNKILRGPEISLQI